MGYRDGNVLFVVLWLLQFTGFNLLFSVPVYVLRRVRAYPWPPKPAKGLCYFPTSCSANRHLPTLLEGLISIDAVLGD